MIRKIAFIGAGSMAEAIISGILNKGFVTKEQVVVTNKENDERLTTLQESFGIQHERDKEKVVEDAEIVILAMKPKDAYEAIQSIKSYVRKDQLIISVLAGISISFIEHVLDQHVPIIRAMPNTSAAIGYSATALAKGDYVEDRHMEMAEQLFATIGTTTIVAEDDLHIVTGLSGSGPAYIYYLVEAMEKAASEAGLSREVYKELIVQTLVGAAEMLKTSQEEPSVLRKKITSPGGTTQAGIETLNKYRYQEALIECVKSASNRSVELGKIFEKV